MTARTPNIGSCPHTMKMWFSSVSKTDFHFSQVGRKSDWGKPLYLSQKMHTSLHSHPIGPNMITEPHLAAREAMCLPKIQEDSITNKNKRKINTRGNLTSMKPIDRNFSN